MWKGLEKDGDIFRLQNGLLSTDPTLPNIVVTEPRRISAISLATRVSQEMGESGPGSNQSFVGYQIRFVRTFIWHVYT